MKPLLPNLVVFAFAASFAVPSLSASRHLRWSSLSDSAVNSRAAVADAASGASGREALAAPSWIALCLNARDRVPLRARELAAADVLGAALAQVQSVHR